MISLFDQLPEPATLAEAEPRKLVITLGEPGQEIPASVVSDTLRNTLKLLAAIEEEITGKPAEIVWTVTIGNE